MDIADASPPELLHSFYCSDSVQTMTSDSHYYDKGIAAEDGLSHPTHDSERSIENEPTKETTKQRFVRSLMTPGSAIQIVIAAILGLAIGLVTLPLPILSSNMY